MHFVTLGAGVDLGEGKTDCMYRAYSWSLIIYLENCMSALSSACLSPRTVHFSIAGIVGWARVYEDAEEDGGFLAGGGEGKPPHLGVQVAVRANRRLEHS